MIMIRAFSKVIHHLLPDRRTSQQIEPQFPLSPNIKGESDMIFISGKGACTWLVSLCLLFLQKIIVKGRFWKRVLIKWNSRWFNMEWLTRNMHVLAVYCNYYKKLKMHGEHTVHHTNIYTYHCRLLGLNFFLLFLITYL